MSAFRGWIASALSLWFGKFWYRDPRGSNAPAVFYQASGNTAVTKAAAGPSADLTLLLVGNLALSIASNAQPIGHRMGSVRVDPGGALRLELEGKAAASQNRYFDLFPVERSLDLVHWTAIDTATRTNAAGSNVLLTESSADVARAFYRTPTNILVSPLPPLTGPYAVGSLSKLLTDFSRTNATRRTNHQFMVSIYYPANAPSGVLPEKYWEPAMIPEIQKWYAFTPDRNWYSRDYRNAPQASAAQPWPVLLYSPSLNSERRENLFKLLNLASHGFVVATMDHRETFASAFPDGTIVQGPRVIESSISSIKAAINDRLADMQFVLGELTRMNANPVPQPPPAGENRQSPSDILHPRRQRFARCNSPAMSRSDRVLR